MSKPKILHNYTDGDIHTPFIRGIKAGHCKPLNYEALSDPSQRSSQQEQSILSPGAHKPHTKRESILGHKTSLRKIRFKTAYDVFSHRGVDVEVDGRMAGRAAYEVGSESGTKN